MTKGLKFYFKATLEYGPIIIVNSSPDTRWYFRLFRLTESKKTSVHAATQKLEPRTPSPWAAAPPDARAPYRGDMIERL